MEVFCSETNLLFGTRKLKGIGLTGSYYGVLHKSVIWRFANVNRSYALLVFRFSESGVNIGRSFLHVRDDRVLYQQLRETGS